MNGDWEGAGLGGRSLCYGIVGVGYGPGLWCGIAHCGKSSISIFEQFFASVDKIFILGAGGLGAGL